MYVSPPHEADLLTHLNPQALNDTNDMRLSVFDNLDDGQVLLSAVFDNLGKGASGAAVQNPMLAREKWADDLSQAGLLLKFQSLLSLFEWGCSP
ncbi:hypothetical protein [Caballeronia insecticola]|uniref:N-acetyl-gamma-glutamyl-phosphate reductase n=1 Tax=Caballeronia insecticola TaxID=758793 RepID=A0A060PGV0_9BURK|nr:N-acetyl-gamma-glutamyl-phosphate reductase [Caballeronia insecticola]